MMMSSNFRMILWCVRRFIIALGSLRSSPRMRIGCQLIAADTPRAAHTGFRVTPIRKPCVAEAPERDRDEASNVGRIFPCAFNSAFSSIIMGLRAIRIPAGDGVPPCIGERIASFVAIHLHQPIGVPPSCCGDSKCGWARVFVVWWLEH
mmetsp:Transcript_4403/g.12990  ORF Transcript_4403/g.12990 Transcript_4403/m.12990 type:complete len:149 (+) Transcript_4403:1859-2305(+)